jgi:hypothetical protein
VLCQATRAPGVDRILRQSADIPEMQVTRPAVQRENYLQFSPKMVVYDSTTMGICFARSWGYNGCSLRTKHTASIGLKENYFKKMFFSMLHRYLLKKTFALCVYIYSVKGKIALQIRVFFGSFLHTGSRRKRIL